jgi:hypothetical protein
MPEIAVELVDRPAERPRGAGEPAAAMVPSAVSNAVSDAAGVRLRSAPFTAAKLRARRRGRNAPRGGPGVTHDTSRRAAPGIAKRYCPPRDIAAERASSIPRTDGRG